MKVSKKIGVIALAATMAFGVTACGGGESGDAVRLDFLYSGNNDMLVLYKNMIDEYNATQGKTDGINVKGMPVSAGNLDSKLTNSLPQSSGPDVAIITDDIFKKHTKNLTDINGLISTDIMNDLYESQKSRYYYNMQTNTSKPDDALYGLPVYNDATVLYYNKTALETQGVKCISVEESELEAFNNGAADHNGKTKADYGLDGVTVPAKGFYRSINNYVSSVSDKAGGSWKMPLSSEVMIFNERIACNWDELEDIGLLCTKTRNPSSTTQYGYYTEWWFNYGWSVGGDCMEDLTGNGTFVYSHPDTTPNYIVNEGKTFTGSYTDTVYEAGETLNIKDIIAVSGDTISYATDEKTYFNYTVNGEPAEVIESVATSDALTQLPSIREAFERFCNLAGVGGLNVCPHPSAFNATTSVSYFTSSKLAFLIEKVSNYDQIDRASTFDWGVARMPIYKTYTNAMDPNCDTVAAQGKMASHSVGYSLTIRKGTPIQEKSVKFIEWMMSTGQTYLAEQGYASSRKANKALMTEKMQTTFGANAASVVESLVESKAGDWWYMPDRGWIDNWANPLNSEVRYGNMSFNDFIYKYIEATNEDLDAYKGMAG